MKKLLVLILALACIMLTACSSKPDVTLQFGDDSNISELDGKEVSINGFLASVDTDSLTGYLVPSPYDETLDFSKNKSTLTNALMFVMPEKEPYTITTKAITVTGVVRLKEYTDSMGYTADWYIEAETVKELSPEKGSEIETYSYLEEHNFIQLFDTYMSEVYATLNYEEMEEDPELLPNDLFSDLLSLFDDKDTAQYSATKQLVIDAMVLVNDTNDMFLSGDLSSIEELNQRGLSLYDTFYKWLDSITFSLKTN